MAVKIIGLGLFLFAVVFVFFPVFGGSGHSKAHARGYACLSNVKQQGVAALIYASDHNDRFPNRSNWMDTLLPYLPKRENVFHCPAEWNAQEPRRFGYSFHAKLSNSNDLSNAETKPLIFDSILLSKNVSGSLNSLPKPGRHFGSNSVVYADGHAKRVPSP